MPPSEKVSREAIVAAAVAVIESEGLPSLTARRVAAELGGSTGPVYRHFESMDALAVAALESARDQLLDYTARAVSDRPFLDIGAGIARFARDRPRLYRALFLEAHAFGAIVEGFLDRLTEDMRKDQRFTTLDRARRAVLLDRMWTYTHGLASLIAVGLNKDTSDEAIVRSLGAVGRAVIRDVLAGES